MHYDLSRNLCEILEESDSVKHLIKYNSDFAGELYSSLCNIEWVDLEAKLPEGVDAMVDKLNGVTYNTTWSCSWRAAGGIVADLRNKYLKANEDYMDWYCRGNEGYVSDLVLHTLAQHGFKPREISCETI